RSRDLFLVCGFFPGETELTRLVLVGGAEITSLRDCVGTRTDPIRDRSLTLLNQGMDRTAEAADGAVVFRNEDGYVKRTQVRQRDRRAPEGDGGVVRRDLYRLRSLRSSLPYARRRRARFLAFPPPSVNDELRRAAQRPRLSRSRARPARPWGQWRGVR